jgi:hypothetical protein
MLPTKEQQIMPSGQSIKPPKKVTTDNPSVKQVIIMDVLTNARTIVLPSTARRSRRGVAYLPHVLGDGFVGILAP